MKLTRTRWWSLPVLSLGGIALGAAQFTAGGASVTAMGGCSNNSNMEVNTGSSSGGSSGSSSGTSSGTTEGGSGGGSCMSGCTFPPTGTIAAKLALDTMWPSSVAITGCDMSSCNAQMRQLGILLALNYTLDPSTNKYTGVLKTCTDTLPPITLSDTGAKLVGEPAGTMVQNIYPDSTWDSPNQPSIPITGTLGGSGGTLSLDSVVALDGLKQTSMLKDPTVMWPPQTPMSMVDTTPAIPMSDMENDDGNGWGYGVTVLPRQDAGFFTPRVALTMTAPQADAFFVVTRTQFILNGCMSSCTEGSGTPQVPLLENHVIGCHLLGQGDAAADFCNPTQYNFIDQNTTNYVVTGGTFTAKILTMGTGDGGSVSCADVRAAML